MNAINVIFQWKMNIMILNGIYRFDFMFKVEFKYRPFINEQRNICVLNLKKPEKMFQKFMKNVNSCQWCYFGCKGKNKYKFKTNN